MSGPDQPRDQDSWQPPPEGVAPDGSGSEPAPEAAPAPVTQPADAGVDADSGVTQVVRAEDLQAASYDAPLPPAPVAANPPTEPAAQAAPSAQAAPNAAGTGSQDPDATSVYAVPSDPGAFAPGAPVAGGVAAGYAAASYPGGYDAGRYSPADPDAPRPYETPAYAPASGPTQTSYSYQEPGYGYAPAQPVAEPPPVLAPARTRVIIPKTPSRAGANALAALIGLLLTFGGLALLVLVPLPNASLTIVANKILVIVVVLIMMVPALLLAWGAAATFLPGLIFTAISLYLLIGGVTAVKQTHDGLGTAAWVDRTIAFFGSIEGLAVGLALLFASIAAMMVRRYTRRAVQDAFDAEYASEQIRPMQRQ
jgi:hypothetical protein